MALVPVVSQSNTQESTTSTTFVATDTSIAGASLGSVEYLVLYCAGYGSAGFNEGDVQITHGATQVARAFVQGTAGSTRESLRTHNLSGFMVLTTNGSDALALTYRTTTGTIFIAGKAIVAVPLTELVENVDYFENAQNNSENVASSTSTTFVNVLSQAFTIAEAGDYVVLACMEASMTGISATSAVGMRLQIDGVTSKREFAKEIRGGLDRFSFMVQRVHSLTAGSHTFTIQGNRAAGAGTSNLHRPRIFVLRLDAFQDKAFSNTDTVTAIPAAYATFTTHAAATFTPSESETVLLLGNSFLRATTDGPGAGIRLRDVAGAVSFADAVGGSNDEPTVDAWTASCFGVQTAVSVAKSYAVQATESPNNGEVSFSDVAAIGMVLTPLGPPMYAVSVGSSVAVEIGTPSGRDYIEIKNFGPGNIYLGSSAVTISDGMPVQAGDSIRFPSVVADDSIYAISDGSARIRVLQAT